MTYDPTTHDTVLISDVIVPDDHRKVDQETASMIAKSIRMNALFHPIVVQRREIVSALGTKKDTKIFLIAGAQRLRAAELAGLKEIPATFLEGDDRRARLVSIEENLCRKDLTALERSRQLAQWVKMTEDEEGFGQNVQNPKGGRPGRGISRAARKLSITVKKLSARRKLLERSMDIDRISPEAETTAKAMGLDDDASALLEIAKEAPEAQVQKAHEIAGRKRAAGGKRGSRDVSKKPLSAEDQKSLEKLIEVWNDAHELKRAFIKASPNVRERFISKMRKEKSAGPVRNSWGKTKRGDD